jgi:putative ABC transport system permease protein
LDVPTFLFAMGLVGATAALFGLGPAVQLTRIPLVASLRDGGRTSAGSSGAGRAKFVLLVAEVALSLVLLLGAGLLLRSFARLQGVNPGWNAAGVSTFTLSLPPSRYADDEAVVTASDELDQRLSAIPGVDRVGRIQGLPLGPMVNVLNFTRPDRPAPRPGQVPQALYRTVDPDYFRAMGIPIVAGRHFTDGDRIGGAPVIIIGRAMANRYWPGEDPIGKTLQMGGPDTIAIVGVVADVRSETLTGPPQPEMYRPQRQTADRAFTVVIKSDRDPGHVLAEARAIVHRFDQTLPLISPAPMQQLVDEAVAQPRFYLLLVSLFAMLAVVLAAVGIYGVVAYMVGQRTREIGVRMALGARAGEVIGLVMWQGLRPALVGAAIGLGISVAGAGALQNMLYEVEPRDSATLVGVTALLLAMVLVACLVPAARATRIPPTSALRSD